MLYERLDDYQKEGVRFCLEAEGSLLFFDQGTGKTWVAGGVIEKLMQFNAAKLQALCVVPLANLETSWVALLKQIHGLNVCTTLEEFRTNPAPRVFVVNYENLYPKLEWLLVQPWSTVIYDEGHRLKDRASKASRAAARFKSVEHRIVLTGTPIDKGQKDLWAQFRFACPEVFGKRWADFDDEYLIPCGYMGYDRKFNHRKLRKFNKLIQPHCFRLETEDVIKLPPLTTKHVKVNLTGTQRRMYDEMNAEMLTHVSPGIRKNSGRLRLQEFLPEGRVSAGLTITQLVRLAQICGGHVKDDEGEFHRVGRAKSRKLRGLLKTLDYPVAVFCKYRHEVDEALSIARRLSPRVESLDGRTSRKKKPEIQTRFQEGHIDILVCQTRAGSVGIDLFRANQLILYSFTHSYIDFSQIIKRVHRRGQTKPVTIWLFYAHNTIDEDIYKAILDKHTSAEKTLQRLNPRRRRAMAETFKYGVVDLAERMKLQPGTVRIKLRRAGIPRVGRAYGWNSVKEMKEVMERIR